MHKNRYLNVYVHGEKKSVVTLQNKIQKSLDKGWTVVEDSTYQRSPGEEVQEYRLSDTTNNNTGFLRFFCSADKPFVFYLRDSGIIGRDTPITVQDNDTLVRHFVASVLKPACEDLELKVEVTRAVKH